MAESDREPSATLGDALAETLEPDPLALEVARAKVAAALFDDTRRVQLGRYQLLERVGSGGMGVVWGAWDPELERRVAIKIVRSEIARSRERVREEGQALAKLSHPNVVPVHDVGVVDDQVYLVMEWVRGKTLREHCKTPRTIRELLALYRSAGAGLRAAHEAGLIHRDFKPDNVMVGEDGRVRVLDFGIALALDNADAAERAGTPRYMPEEQASGGTVTAAVDQYAFCVSLREAIVERTGANAAPVPPWIAAILDRGSARAAADRYPSMAELLDALERDPRTIWRTRIAVGGVLAFAGAAFALGTLRSSKAEDPCTGSATELAGAWNDDVRGKLVAHLKTLGPYATEQAVRMERELGEYRGRWIDAHHGACEAHAHGELTPQLYERRLACLAGARAAFEAVVEVAGRVPAERFGDAVIASRGLPVIDRCATDAIASPVAPPATAIAPAVARIGADVARAHVLWLAKDPGAPAAASAAASAADRLGYPPLLGRALLELGAALVSDKKRVPEAIAAYERATTIAFEANDDVTFVEAYARELYALRGAVPPGVVNTPAGVAQAQRIAKRTGTAGAFARGLLYNNAGIERMAAGDRAGARSWFSLALAEQRAGAPGTELWTSYGNLALVTDDRAEQMRLFAEERAQLERELGAHHPFLLEARHIAAQFIADSRIAIQELDTICGELARWHPGAAGLVPKCRYALGWLVDEAGDVPRARAAMALATAEPGPSGQLAAIYAQLTAGDRGAAVSRAEALADKLAADPGWWNRFFAVDALLLVAAGDPARVRPALERALVLLDDPAFNRSATFVQRRRARVEELLAKQLAKTDPARAATLAASSLAWSRAAGGYDTRVAELTSIGTGSR